jgi:hypothetical protein
VSNEFGLETLRDAYRDARRYRRLRECLVRCDELGIANDRLAALDAKLDDWLDGSFDEPKDGQMRTIPQPVKTEYYSRKLHQWLPA